MGGRMSKNKGRRGEREFAHYLSSFGFEAKRGWADGYDIECLDLPVHFEVKRTERLNLWPSLLQAKRDTNHPDSPVVVHRPNRRGWIIITPADRYLELHLEIRNLKRRLEELE